MQKLFIFNPDCELAIAGGGKFYTPPSNIVTMIEELAFLPAWMGEEGDYVLMPMLPDDDFLDSVVRPLSCPVKAITEAKLSTIGKVDVQPWGLSPKMCHWLAKRGWGQEWYPAQKEWYSRKTARSVLLHLAKLLPNIEARIVPRVCYTLEELTVYTGKGMWIAKAPWSSSGKGLLVFQSTPTAKECEWMTGVLHRQGYLMLEPLLDKIVDFALEFQATDKGICFVGWSLFHTGQHGEYMGNFVGSQDAIVVQLAKFIDLETLMRLPKVLASALETLLPEYRGYLGVDMMIYRDEEGNIKIQPCVEINLRYNMGIMALAFSDRYLHPGVYGQFSVHFYPVQGEALQVHLKHLREHPLMYKDSRILSGYLPLIPITETTKFVASVCCY